MQLRDVLLEQRYEQQSLLSANFVPRDHPEGLLEHKLVTVVLGPRRAGKSLFAHHLLRDVGGYGYVNFDDDRLLNIDDTGSLLATIDSLYDRPTHLLLDEVQNLPQWQLFVNRLQRQGRRLVVTGSNARLLSDEFATHLTGRHVPIVLFPFSFREYLRAHPALQTDADRAAALDAYAVSGGYPEIVVDGIPRVPYLRTLLDSIVFKDIVTRYRVRHAAGIGDIRHHLMANVASEYSAGRLASLAGMQSKPTILKYIGYLETAFVFFSLPRFSFKVREQARSNKKIYAVDNGFVTSTGFQFSPRSGHLFENLVAVQLQHGRLQHELELFFWKDVRHEEVDFIVKQGSAIVEAIQVCLELSDDRTRQWEIRGLLKAKTELGCTRLTVLTRTYEATETVRWFDLCGSVDFVPLWKWLLRSDGGCSAR